MLMGAARYLAQEPDFAETVYFVFQPAEESGTGAGAMMKDGLLERFPFDVVYGLQTDPGLIICPCTAVQQRLDCYCLARSTTGFL